jgi:hypothetical protein
MCPKYMPLKYPPRIVLKGLVALDPIPRFESQGYLNSSWYLALGLPMPDFHLGTCYFRDTPFHLAFAPGL